MSRGALLAGWTLRLAAATSALSMGCVQAAPFAYIPHAGIVTDGELSVIDTATNTIVATVTGLGSSPTGVAILPDASRVFVANAFSGTVSVIDTATHTVTATIAVGMAPNAIRVNPSGSRVYVVNARSSSISVIDVSTLAVISTIPVTSASDMTLNPAGTRAYVSNQIGANISVIDTVTNSVIATVPMPASTGAIAVNPAGTRAYVAAFLSERVFVLDLSTNTVIATIPTAAPPGLIAVDPSGTRAFVTGVTAGAVFVIDLATNTVVATISVGRSPFGIDVHPLGTHVYVVNQGSANVSVVDAATNAVVAAVPVGPGPGARVRFISPIAPSAPTIGRATAGNGQATLAFGAPLYTGGSPITSYTATCNPGVITASGSASPITVTGLTNGVTYSCTVTATNAYGTSPSSAAVMVTPAFNTFTGPSATGTGNITASFTGGGAACSYSAPRYIGIPPGAPPIPPTTPGPNILFPHGLFDFSTVGCTPGSTLNFTITYPSALPPGTVYWKYGPRAGFPIGWYVLPASIVGNTATFSITDGGLGDDDLAANGTIVDQGGPGFGFDPLAAPTLSEWSMVALALLLGWMGVRSRSPLTR